MGERRGRVDKDAPLTSHPCLYPLALGSFDRCLFFLKKKTPIIYYYIIILLVFIFN